MNAYETLVNAFHAAGLQVRGNPDRARAQCPVHGSKGGTISIRRRDDRALLHCFAGCPDTEVLAAIGLHVKDLFDHDRPETQTVTRVDLAWIRQQDELERIAVRAEQQERIEARAEYWLRRAEEFAAVGTPGCDEIAQACGHRAEMTEMTT